MSVFAQTALFLVAVCCGATFADMHPSQSASAPEPNESSGPGAQLAPENTSRDFAVPQVGALATNLLAHSKDVLPSDKLSISLAMIGTLEEISANWRGLQSRIRADEVAVAACRSDQTACSPAARRFLAIVDLGQKREGRIRLGWINRAVNMAIRPVSDWAQDGYADFWASLLQTLSSEAGDCEDYAIVKYVALRELGVLPDDLRLVIDARRPALVQAMWSWPFGTNNVG